MRINLLVAGAAGSLAVVYLAAIRAIPHLSIGDPLGPRAFPILIGAGLLFASGLLVMETLKAQREGKPEEEGFPPFNGKLLAVMGAIVLLMICFEPVGYLISIGLFLIGLTMFLNRGHTILNIVFSVGFTVISAYVFDHLLSVRLPAGIWGI